MQWISLGSYLEEISKPTKSIYPARFMLFLPYGCFGSLGYDFGIFCKLSFFFFFQKGFLKLLFFLLVSGTKLHSD